MGARGPAPVPSALKLLRGNPGRRPIHLNEPKPAPVAPPCPSWLDNEAKREWKRVEPELDRLGLLTRVDMAALAGYCQAYSRWMQAETVLTMEGFSVVAPSGYVQQRPEVAIAQKYLGIVKGFCAEFGLSPSSRARMTVPGSRDAEEEDIWDA